jgi:RHS repeat-associated protein
MITRGGSGITWYSYNQPNRINAGAYYSEFSYTANHQRWKQVATDATGTTTTRYIGGLMEKLERPGSVIEYRHMIPAGSGTAIYMRKPDGTNATTYLTTDHLGSGDLILDSSGNVLAKQSFTAFGARRGSNWQGLPSSANYTTFADKTRRGFTGHEMLDAVGLVNMNGRVYDPLIGRFLSADPIIQTINLSQALNPYSYVMNMPLTLIDPSGYSWLSKLFHGIGKFFKKWGAMIIGIGLTLIGCYPLIAGLVSSAFSTAVNGGTLGSFLTGFVVGAIASAIAAPIGDSLSGALRIGGQGLLASVARGAITGAFAGGIASSIMGGSFWAGFTGGALAGAIAGGLTWWAMKYLVPAATSNAESGTEDTGRDTAAAKSGRPLTEDEKKAFAGQFPDEVLESARIHEGTVPWWLRKGMRAVTLGKEIYIRSGEYQPGTADGVELLGHELVHVQQYAAGMTVAKYLWESWRGYRNNPYEKQAYDRQGPIRDSFCSTNPQAKGC